MLGKENHGSIMQPFLEASLHILAKSKDPDEMLYSVCQCTGPRLSTKFIMLINVKMPTIVGILTFISMINTTSDRPIASNFFHLSVF